MKLHNKTAILALALLAASPSAFAQAASCLSASSDSDNDGWGWENGASCIVVSASAPASSTSTDESTFCSSPDADPDGDGWGWENNTSCLVQSQNESDSTAQNLAGDPVCSSADFDQDGDGWGWENNRSCIVNSSSSDSSIPTPDNNAGAAPVGLAQCSSAAFDEDGDGWGWENNASCLVAANEVETNTPTELEPAPVEPVEPVEPIVPPVACSVPAFDDDNDGFGFENNQVCIVETPAIVRIMALGDSITHGSSTAQAESYRKPLNELMTSDSCQFEMVGSQTGNHRHSTFVSPHEGYNAHTADHILNGHISDSGNNEGISVTSNRYQPHVVLLHIGSNDMKLGQDVDQTVGEIDQIISVILATDSAPVVFLANVIPWLQDASINANVEILSNRIEAYVTQLNNPRVRIVDVRTGFESSMMLSDYIHPNPAGEQHIASRFFEAYEDAGFCR